LPGGGGECAKNWGKIGRKIRKKEESIRFHAKGQSEGGETTLQALPQKGKSNGEMKERFRKGGQKPQRPICARKRKKKDWVLRGNNATKIVFNFGGVGSRSERNGPKKK